MNKQEIEKIVKNFIDKSQQYGKYREDEIAYFRRVAEQIEVNIEMYEDDCYETEEDIIYDVEETFAQVDNLYDEEDYENMDMLD